MAGIVNRGLALAENAGQSVAGNPAEFKALVRTNQFFAAYIGKVQLAGDGGCCVAVLVAHGRIMTQARLK